MRQAIAIGILTTITTGCGGLVQPDPRAGDCQMRAGAAITEGQATFAPIGGAIDARAGAYTRLGECTEEDYALARELANQPIQVTPAQLRQLLEDAAP